MFAPVTGALVEAGEIAGQQVILDVATGPGEPALSVAGLVGAEGKVYGIDLAPEMVAAARRAAERHGLRNAQFETATAEHLPFSAESFDAVISRFGVMFFPSPVEGVREMLRVLKPGGKLALAVWHFAASNPFHHVLSRVMDRYVESPAPAPDAPDAFRFAGLGKLLEVFSEAGAMDARERVLAFRIEAPLAAGDFWMLRQEMSDKLREKVATLTKQQRKQVEGEVFEALREYTTGKGMSFPAEVLIVSGSKRRGKG